MATAQNFKGGGHRTEKMYTGRGDTAHIFLIKGTIRVEKNIYTGRGGHRTYLIEVETLHIPYWGRDTAHDLVGWGHRT